MPYDLREQGELCISMPSLDVMWCLPSEERGRNRHGRHGMYLMRSQQPSVTLASSRLKSHNTDLKTLERFVVLMYDRSSAATGVDQARLHMFARKQRPYDSITPTHAALREHAKRAAYQAGVI